MSGRPIFRCAACCETLGRLRELRTEAETEKVPGPRRSTSDLVPGDPGHLIGVVDGEGGVAMAELFDQERRGDPLRLLHEAADLDVAVERVPGGLPGHELGAEEEAIVGEELVGLARGAHGACQRLVGGGGVGPAEELVVVPELVGEREDAQVLVGPADEAAVHVVQVAVDHQAPIEGDHPRTDPADLLGDPLVGPGILRLAGRVRGPAEDHPGGVVERLHPRDVGVIEQELGDRAGLRPAERVIPRAGLDRLGLPVGGPVPVHVVAAGGVFIDRPVAVVIDPLQAEHLVLPALSGLDRDEQAGVLGRDLGASAGVLAAHLGDLAVAIQVVVSVLVGLAVAIVVERALPPRELFVVFGPLNQ